MGCLSLVAGEHPDIHACLLEISDGCTGSFGFRVDSLYVGVVWQSLALIGDVNSDLQGLGHTYIRSKQGLLGVKLLEYGVAWACLELLASNYPYIYQGSCEQREWILGQLSEDGIKASIQNSFKL